MNQTKDIKRKGIASWFFIFLILGGTLMFRCIPAIAEELAMAKQPKGSIVISVRDVETGYALPASISIWSIMEDGSTGPVIDSFLASSGEILKSYPPGKYNIELKMEGYKPMKSWFVVEAGKESQYRYVLFPVESKAGKLQLEEKNIPLNMAMISGYITDDETGQALAGVHIIFKKKGIEVYSDQKGYYETFILVEESIHFNDEEFKALQETIVFSLTGYKTLKETNVLISPGHTLKMTITMFKGEGEIIHDRTHKLLLPPERLRKVEKTKESLKEKLNKEILEDDFSSFKEKTNDSTLSASTATSQIIVKDPPDQIMVGFSSTGGRCCDDCTRYTPYPLEEYVLRGVRQEWWFSGSSDLNYRHSIRAGTIAYRSYGAKHAELDQQGNHIGHDDHSGTYYDICSSPCCQTFDAPYDDVTVIKTAGIMLQKSSSSTIFEAEYTAKNNPCKGCPNGQIGSPNAWPCLNDKVSYDGCCDSSTCGHGRGMSQWGTYRWDKDYAQMWPWMVNHYYNANGGVDGSSTDERTAYMTSPLEIISASPTPSSVSPGQTFTININAQNYAGLAHTQIIIGASLYSSSTSYINDTTNDKKVTLNIDSNNVSRIFKVPSNTPSGTYDLVVTLWLDVDEDGIINTDIDLLLNSKTLQNAISIGSQPLSVTLTANPTSGTAPLNTTFTADVSGTATGTINYTLWWDCDDPGISVDDVMAICGNIPTPLEGTCIGNENGYKCDGVMDDPLTVNHTYSSANIYTAKVIAEQGDSQAENRVQITVTPSPERCSNWGEVISKYTAYVTGQATWEDVIVCFQEYVGFSPTFNAGGRVTNTYGTGIPDVTMTFSRVTGTGTVPSSKQTDSNGYWTQSDFQSGTTYLVTPSKTNYTFEPSSRSFSSASINFDFTGTCIDQCPYTGSLDTTDGLSVTKVGCYADVWTFTLSSATTIQILVSSSFSSCLILYSGGTPSSAGYITESYYSTSIKRDLSPGTYCLEVTSYSQGVTGTYKLTSSVELTQVPTYSYHTTGSLDTTDGLSVTRTGCYADVWTFTLSSTTEIQIGVSPSFDGWLILYSGSTPSSAGYITYSGYYEDLWIKKELGPGTYCIEITTYSQGVTGTYKLTSSVELTP